MKKVLILEDEVSIRSFVVINLKRAGYEVVEAGTGEEALELLKVNPDVGVAILDIMLPGIDGFEVCRNIRATDKKIGIIMLTARSQEMDKITGLMTGADDYMTKPFSPAELTARIDALYRRIDSDGSSNQIELKHGPFVLNTRNRTLDKDSRRIKLTQVEYAIVKLFMQNPGRALSREDILAAVWVLYHRKQTFASVNSFLFCRPAARENGRYSIRRPSGFLFLSARKIHIIIGKNVEKG